MAERSREAGGRADQHGAPVRAKGVEAALVGQPATVEAIRAAADRAAEGTDPMSDANADVEYRTHLAKVLTRRAVVEAAGVG